MTIRCGSASLLLALIGCAAGGPAEPCQVTLTASKTKATCAVPATFLERPPRLVEVPVTKIENPSGQGLSIHMHVAGAKGEPELVGNVSVYPANQTGVFMMRCQQAFERLGAGRAPARISIEIRRATEGQAWQPISVSIGPLRWLYEEPK